jgi:hypothetical protein
MAVLLPTSSRGGLFWVFILGRRCGLVEVPGCRLAEFPFMAVLWSASTSGLLSYYRRPCSSTWVCLNGMLFWLDSF